MNKRDENLTDWSCPGRNTTRDRTGKLPQMQNLEAMVYGRRLMGQAYQGLSVYCVQNCEELQELDFELLSDPDIRNVIREISESEKKPVLEIEAPFSVLAGIVNPMELYACQGQKAETMKKVLHKIADAQSSYLLACVEAGCRCISIADPVGTLNLVGEKYYTEIVGESELDLMNRCVSFPEDVGWYVCPLMARSLELTGLWHKIKVQAMKKCMD